MYRITDLVLDALRPSVEKAVRILEGKVMRATLAGHDAYAAGKVVRIVKRARNYKDRRFGDLCAKGLMPHSKLLKLSKMQALEFRDALEKAIRGGHIERCCDPDTGTTCYRLHVEETAPAPDTAFQRGQPAPAPAQPAQTPLDMAKLDDPAQDSHQWDFAAALKRAREERETY